MLSLRTGVRLPSPPLYNHPSFDTRLGWLFLILQPSSPSIYGFRYRCPTILLGSPYDTISILADLQNPFCVAMIVSIAIKSIQNINEIRKHGRDIAVKRFIHIAMHVDEFDAAFDVEKHQFSNTLFVPGGFPEIADSGSGILERQSAAEKGSMDFRFAVVHQRILGWCTA